MRVGILTREWPPDIYGGAGVHVDELVRELRPLADVRVHAFGPTRDGAKGHQVPPDFAKDTPPIKIHRISEYDKDGPFWAWNWLELGEHSGTHFDAPHHWITGKDYADGYTDTLDVQRLVAPVNVLDFSAECAANPDFLLTIDHVNHV